MLRLRADELNHLLIRQSSLSLLSSPHSALDKFSTIAIFPLDNPSVDLLTLTSLTYRDSLQTLSIMVASATELIRITQIYSSAVYAVMVWDWILCATREWKSIWMQPWCVVKVCDAKAYSVAES